MDCNAILLNLSRCTTKQLHQIQSQVDFLLKQKDGELKPKSPLIDAVLICAKKWVSVPPKYLLETKDPKGLGTRLANVCIEIDKLVLDMGLTRVETIKLIKILLEAGVIRLREIPLPVSFTTLVAILSNPGETLDQQFPNYTTNLFKQLVLNRS